MEQKKRKFPGLCISNDPAQAKNLLDDVKVAQQAMDEVRLLLPNHQGLPH